MKLSHLITGRALRRCVVCPLLLLATRVVAEVPATVTYQGYLSDANSVPLNAVVDIVFKLCDLPTGSCRPDSGERWTEEQANVSVDNGVFSVALGSVVPIPDGAWATPPWLSVHVGGVELRPRQSFSAVAYALRARAIDLPDGVSQADFEDLLRYVLALRTRLQLLDADGLSTRDAATVETLRVTDSNLQIVNGEGLTASNNGRGNLLVGYDEPGLFSDPGQEQATATEKSGSHNLVIGPLHHYSRAGGLVAGVNNKITAPGAAILGGRGNLASGFQATVVGGQGNLASGDQATVSGGQGNVASASQAHVAGGQRNQSTFSYSSVLGGVDNLARADHAAVVGGRSNTASGDVASVLGGDANQASGEASTVSGGTANWASGEASSVSGGEDNQALEASSMVSGGALNRASGAASSVSGGSENEASGSSSAVSGGWQNVADGAFASVSGGALGTARGNAAAVNGGWKSLADGNFSGVLSGFENTAGGMYAAVLGGSSNRASGTASAISGGKANTASGGQTAILGGTGVSATDLALPRIGYDRANETRTITSPCKRAEASGNYLEMDNNSIELTTGVWRVHRTVHYRRFRSSQIFSFDLERAVAGLFSENGDGTPNAPSQLFGDGRIVVGKNIFGRSSIPDEAQFSLDPLLVEVSGAMEEVFLVPSYTGSTPDNVCVQVFLSAERLPA